MARVVRRHACANCRRLANGRQAQHVAEGRSPRYRVRPHAVGHAERGSSRSASARSLVARRRPGCRAWPVAAVRSRCCSSSARRPFRALRTP